MLPHGGQWWAWLRRLLGLCEELALALALVVWAHKRGLYWVQPQTTHPHRRQNQREARERLRTECFAWVERVAPELRWKNAVEVPC